MSAKRPPRSPYFPVARRGKTAKRKQAAGRAASPGEMPRSSATASNGGHAPARVREWRSQS